MLGIKLFSSTRNTAIILLLLLLVILLITRNNQTIMRAMVSQEIELKTAQFEQVETEHFRIKYTPVDEEYIAVISSNAEEAYTEVTAEFTREPETKTTLIVYPDSVSLAKSFGWDRDEKAMGVYWAGTIRILSPGEWITGGDIAEQYSNEGPMVHEFTHLMVDDMTSGNYNRWWTEGIAQYVEKKLTGFQFSDPFAGKKKVFYYDLAVLGKDFDCLNQQVAYWESLQAVEFIVNHYGEDKIYSILEYLGKGYSLQRAIMVSLNIEYQDFCQDFYVELEKQ